MKTKFTSRTHVLLAMMLISLFFISSLQAAKKEVWPFTLNCPANVYVSCTDELWNLSIYGNATYTYGYYTYSAGAPTVEYFLNSCNAGYIKRTWMVEDFNWNWHTCSQYIYVSSTGSGGPAITWPEDIELEGCNPNTNPYQLSAPYNYPTWTSSECSMLGKSYSDMVFTVNSQCKKVMRTWKILDWCNYSPTSGYGIYTKVQFLYLINNTVPVVECPSEIILNAFNCKNAELITAPLAVDTSVCGGQFEITNNSPYSNSKGNNISGTYPIGTTKVTYSVKYACGKTKYCTTNVVVKNANRPTPYCLGSLITTLMALDTDNDGKIDNGMVELWAKDLDKGSKSLCGNYPLKFSFSKDVKETNKTFTCDHVGKNSVEMWVTDSKGAQSYCIVDIIIQNNGANIPDCQPKPVAPIEPVYAVKGKITFLDNTPVKEGIVTLKYIQPIVTYTSTFDTVITVVLDSFINASGYKLYRYNNVKTVVEKKDSTVNFLTYQAKSKETGVYILDSLSAKDKKFVVSARYSDAPRASIDSKDVELLTKYLLGDLEYTEYYQYLASDVNEDGKIDLADLNLLIEFVSKQIEVLPGQNNWYLLDKKVSFTKPIDVLKPGLSLEVGRDSISKTNEIIDFLAIKKGNISLINASGFQSTINLRSKTQELSGIKVYPNPFASLLSFEIQSAKSDQVFIKLYNVNGQLLQSFQRTIDEGNNNIQLDLNTINNGLIMYQVNTSDQQYNGLLTKHN